MQVIDQNYASYLSTVVAKVTPENKHDFSYEKAFKELLKHCEVLSHQGIANCEIYCGHNMWEVTTFSKRCMIGMPFDASYHTMFEFLLKRLQECGFEIVSTENGGSFYTTKINFSW